MNNKDMSETGTEFARPTLDQEKLNKRAEWNKLQAEGSKIPDEQKTQEFENTTLRRDPTASSETKQDTSASQNEVPAGFRSTPSAYNRVKNNS